MTAKASAGGSTKSQPRDTVCQMSIQTMSAWLADECETFTSSLSSAWPPFIESAALPERTTRPCTSAAPEREDLHPFCPAMSPGSTAGASNVSRNAARAKSLDPSGLSPFAASHQSGSPSPSLSPLWASGSVPARNSTKSDMPSPSESALPSCERSPKCSTSHSSGSSSPSEERPRGRSVVTRRLSATPEPLISMELNAAALPRMERPSPTITPSTYMSHVRDA